MPAAFGAGGAGSTGLLGGVVGLARQRANVKAATNARGEEWGWECGTLENMAPVMIGVH